MSAKTTLSENIKYYRRVKGWTQAQLADRIPGVSKSVIGSYEEGRARPSFETLGKMVDLFLLENLNELVESRVEFPRKVSGSKKDLFFEKYWRLSEEKKKIVDFILNN